jgi:Mrp family chromosome partitioning ATPase
VDGIVLVVRAGQTPRAAVIRARDRLMAVGGRILGVVLNCPRERTSPYGYHYRDYAYDYALAGEGSEFAKDNGHERQKIRRA